MKRSTTSCFPDINVWLALAVKRHVFHPLASAWWEQDDSDAIGFCRFTQIGLLRHLTTEATMKGKPLTNEQAWRVYEGFRADVRVRLFPEIPPLDEAFKTYSNIAQPAPKIWGDCYLAAHAVTNAARLITFDKDFSKYEIDCLILTS
jgi:toxin-antitoxin system PIN domain toxin